MQPDQQRPCMAWPAASRLDGMASEEHGARHNGTADTMDSRQNELTQSAAPAVLRSMSVAELMAAQVLPREAILSPWLRTADAVLVYALRGIGKTFLALSIALAIASGMPLLGWEVLTRRRILYVDGEMGIAAIRERLKNLANSETIESLDPYLRFITQDGQNGFVPDLNTPAGIESLKRHLDGIDLVVLDNLSSLTRCGNENDAESWQSMHDFIQYLRKRSIAVIIIHHSGKGGRQQRGTSRREDNMDLVIGLRLPANHTPMHGAKCILTFEKARGLTGESLRSRSIELRREKNGLLEWAEIYSTAMLAAQAAALEAAGNTQREIGRKIGKSASRVNELLKQARRADGSNVA